MRPNLDAEECLLSLAKQAGKDVGPGSDDGAVAAHPPDSLQTCARGYADLSSYVLVRHSGIDLQ
ncbi:hypothetical protein GCM10009689_16810 [Brevibacterium antiquum]